MDCSRFYGITDAEGLRFFNVHREADGITRRQWRA